VLRKNVAVILAGGIGTRTGLDTPKQFLKVAGKTIVEHTVEAFERNSYVNEIAIVVHPAYVTTIENMVLRNKWGKTNRILKGGSERYQSSLAAIRAYSDDSSVNLIFHDAVRPLVSQRIINDVVIGLEEYEAVDTAIPAVDTIITVTGDKNHIDDIPDRAYVRRGQTPQAFRIDTIRRAYEKAMVDSEFRATDDCGIVIKYLPGTPVLVVDGDETNMKLTSIEDLYILDKLFQLRSEKVGCDTSLDGLRGTTLVVFGGNAGIGKSIVDVASMHGAAAYALSRSLNGIDIRERGSVERALDDISRTEGKIDYVVNSAAILIREPLINMSQDAILGIINTNCLGMINTTLASLPHLERSSGQLLHFTSSSYTRGRAFYSLYSATKAAVVNFVQAIAQEWEPLGVRVNCINPERTRTPMRERNFGIEPENTLLDPQWVAKVSLQTLLAEFTGQVVDVRMADGCLS